MAEPVCKRTRGTRVELIFQPDVTLDEALESIRASGLKPLGKATPGGNWRDKDGCLVVVVKNPRPAS